MGFLIDCSKAKNCCDKAQYKEISYFEKLKLKFHILYCKACKKYTRTNTKLTALIEKASITTCTEKEKQKFREQIRENI